MESAAAPNWSGQRVAFTGRLGSLTRAQARELVVSCGGQFARDVSRSTTALVVGCGGLPLNRKGRLTRKLERARWLQRQRVAVQLLDENQFLVRAGLQSAPGDERLFSLADVERMTQASRDRVRRLIRHGLVQPSVVRQGVPFFDFSDMRVLQHVLGCLEEGIRPETLRRSLRRLTQLVPGSHASLAVLSSLEVWGSQVVLRSADGTLWESSGQRMLDFPDDENAVTLTMPRDLFDEAVTCEEQEDWEGAARAYEALLLRDGPDAEICFDLANVLYSLERLEAARCRFRQAVELEPDYAEAWNNLGNVLALLKDYPSAIDAYECALALAPGWTDARYGLADVLDESGLADQATRHWRLLLASQPDPQYAQYARQRLGG